jgi:hypothetical protein
MANKTVFLFFYFRAKISLVCTISKSRISHQNGFENAVKSCGSGHLKLVHPSFLGNGPLLAEYSSRGQQHRDLH